MLHNQEDASESIQALPKIFVTLQEWAKKGTFLLVFVKKMSSLCSK